jgi:kynurenine formamidase
LINRPVGRSLAWRLQRRLYMAGPDLTRVPEEEVETWFEKYSNWGKWGTDNELGALNYITPEKVLAALKIPTRGVRVSCGRTVDFAPIPPAIEAPIPPVHFMTRTGTEAAAEGRAGSHDWVGFTLHGLHISHLDAPAHVMWDSKMFNGASSKNVTVGTGARRGNIELARLGMVTRGVLLDVPAARGVDWLTDDEAVHYEDLINAEKLGGVVAEEGDVVFVRTGYGARRDQPRPMPGTWKSSNIVMTGLAGDTVPYFYDRSIAVLGTDTGTDFTPGGYKHIESPVHLLCIFAMGVWIIDALNLEDLAAKCKELNSYEFLLTMAPIRFKNSTGSPVNPIATF